jgi:hypothetical protein
VTHFSRGIYLLDPYSDIGSRNIACLIFSVGMTNSFKWGSLVPNFLQVL